VKRFLQAALGLLVSGGALWFTLRGRDLGAIWEAIRAADYFWLIPYLAILTAIHLARTYRWGILLEPVAKVSFGKLNAASAVGWMALVLLPFRLGEFARPYLIAERPRLRVSAALSSVVVERVADGLFTAGLLVVTLLAVPEGTPGLHFLRAGGVAVFLIFAALLAFLVFANRHRARAVRLTHRLVDPISEKLAERVSGMMDAFIHGLRLVPSRRKIALFFFLTGAYWALNGVGMLVLAIGFDIHLSALAAFTVLGVLVVGVMIPAGPGMVGTFQAATMLGLALFLPKQVVDTRGAAYANVLWAVQLAQQSAFGLVFLFSRHIRIANIVAAPEEVGEELSREEEQYVAEPGADAAGGEPPR